MFDHLLRDIRSVVNRDGMQNAIPPLDGALSPNDRLDACTPIGDALPGLDDLVAAKDGSVYVTGSLYRAPGTTYLVQFFTNRTPDPTGYGVGETYLGSVTVTTRSSST